MAGAEGFRESITWLAGLYEGEGTIGAYTKSGSGLIPQLKLCISMTDRDVLERAQAVFGVGKVYGPYMFGPTHYKPKYYWTVGRSPDVYAVAIALYPFLLARRQEQIERALQSWLIAKRARQPSFAERFWAKVDVDGECLIWRGGLTTQRGVAYGAFHVRDGSKRMANHAQRVAYKLLWGIEPPPRLLRSCPRSEALCIAPDHWAGVGNGRR